MDVVILAGGAGRRFGGAKQFTSVAPDQATLLEITLRDAKRAGCQHAIIVTAPGSAEEAQGLFKSRPIERLKVSIAIQRPEDVPFPCPADRSKPWGTAHALWAARDLVKGNFLLFNADDYYGPRAPSVLFSALQPKAELPIFALLGFCLGNTLSSDGSVSRALCQTDRLGFLTSLKEYTAIDGEGWVTSGDEQGQHLPLNALVSMNSWAFTPDIFPILETLLFEFFKTANLDQDECYLPTAMDAAISSGKIKVRVAEAPDRWFGMTWPQDRLRVTEHLKEKQRLENVIKDFGLASKDAISIPFGSGLINSTWRIDIGNQSYVAQKMNSDVFKDPAAIVENAAKAASCVDNTLANRGDIDPRHRLTFLTTNQGQHWTKDDAGAFYRMTHLINNTRPADPSNPLEVHGAAKALGQFPGLVAEGQTPKPEEILVGFHDTLGRLQSFKAAVQEDSFDRFKSCEIECARLLELAPLAGCLSSEEQPTRMVHNDAKLDNVLVDQELGTALCVVDLDTVMPGLAAHDFGDLVRSAVSDCPEDESELEKIEVSLDTFQTLSAGYLEGAKPWIEDSEKAHLVDGALTITYEQALRFLTDYLSGDSYYSVDDALHNLRRARAQLRLLENLLTLETDLRTCINNL